MKLQKDKKIIITQWIYSIHNVASNIARGSGNNNKTLTHVKLTICFIFRNDFFFWMSHYEFFVLSLLYDGTCTTNYWKSENTHLKSRVETLQQLPSMMTEGFGRMSFIDVVVIARLCNFHSIRNEYKDLKWHFFVFDWYSRSSSPSPSFKFVNFLLTALENGICQTCVWDKAEKR